MYVQYWKRRCGSRRGRQNCLLRRHFDMKVTNFVSFSRDRRCLAQLPASSESYLAQEDRGVNQREWGTEIFPGLRSNRVVHLACPPTRIEVEISWQPPPPEWVTLNSYGSVLSDFGLAAAGGLLQDQTGCCLATFALNLGICSIARVKSRGVVEGLQLTWDRGLGGFVLRSIHSVQSNCSLARMR